MVVLSTLAAGRVAKVENAAVESNTLQVVSAEIHEWISQCYRCELELVSTSADLDSAAILQNTAYLGIKQGVTIKGSDKRGVQTLKYQGVFSSFEQCEKHEDLVRYRAVLVPRLWKLSLNVQSRIFMDMTVVEIVEEIVKGAGLDYEFRTGARDYPSREYVAQYQESDFAFVSRLLEHDGIFYFFLQGDEGEKVVFGDSADAFEPILGDAVLPYRSGGGEGAGNQPTDWFLPELVYSFTCRHNLVPAEVVLQDYNYRTPSTDLKSSASVGSSGEGTVYEYGDHFKDTGEGGDLAKVRAEAIKCREKVFPGTSDCKSMRAGGTFEITEHYRSDWNAKYLVTEVRHKLEQSVTLKATAGSVASYENTFVCIPADVVFRPERRTPKPRISGTMNAKVDAAANGQYAEIDDTGRYKITVPFDLSGKSGGTASRYMRKAEPYAGAGMGMHFPLHKGTEVVLAFTNGDPDRPIVVGSVPNAETVGPVTGSNETQCKIATGGGNEITIEDQDGNQRFKMSTPFGNTVFQLGSKNEENEGGTLCTQKTCCLGAEEGMILSAGISGPTEILHHITESFSTIQTGIATLAGALAIVGGSVGSKIAGGHAITGPLIADVAGWVAGAGLPHMLMCALGKTGCLSASETLIGALMTVDVIGLGPVNMMSATEVLVAGGLKGVAIAGVGAVEARSATSNVEIKAKKNVELTAEAEDVTIHAETSKIQLKTEKGSEIDHVIGQGDITLNSGCSINLLSKGVWNVRSDSYANITSKYVMTIESSNSKKIVLKAGESTLTIEDGKISLSANEIHLDTADSLTYLKLKDSGHVTVGSGDEISIEAQKEVSVFSPQKVAVNGDSSITLDGTSVKVNGSPINSGAIEVK